MLCRWERLSSFLLLADCRMTAVTRRRLPDLTLCCGAAELEALWQEQLFCASGRQCEELLLACFTGFFTISAGLLLSKELSSQAAHTGSLFSCHFAEEKEVGLLVQTLE